ncbi:unnamed protein product (macronuclear) [Paramecium tetraurelia]|uniref:SKP1 component POZ domain-containing protein n=1 Tax=Paramecium tetraurelia TaxID=5888 RepID=A0DX70_PARTE|nr:uncharacterized protein GSPATT00021269001 [Paramecium tetraurelia]CAK87637.1 unnamed protein product [Paramecium tetraurelia]|eukprot:XP_001455034.1 hypothetical protein (macronuclear) [Paramecium tetraurelia strain d4-2]
MQVRTIDNQIVTINIEAFLKYSELFRFVYECEQTNDVIDMEIQSGILLKIDQFLTQMLPENPSVIPKPIPSTDLDSFLNPIESNFIKSLQIYNIERQLIRKAADYLGIDMLINLMQVSFAILFIGLTPQQFIEKYQLKVNYTQELQNNVDQIFEKIIIH